VKSREVNTQDALDEYLAREYTPKQKNTLAQLFVRGCFCFEYFRSTIGFGSAGLLGLRWRLCLHRCFVDQYWAPDEGHELVVVTLAYEAAEVGDGNDGGGICLRGGEFFVFGFWVNSRPAFVA